MKIVNRPLLLAATGLMMLSSVPAAHAQREAPSRADRRAERKQANETLTPEQQQANRAARMQERLKSMTPEQRTAFAARRAEMQQKLKDAGIDPNDPQAWQKARAAGIMGNGGGNRAAADAMRQMMIAAGITDKDTQDAVIAYVSEGNKAKASLFQLAQSAAQALQTPATQTVADGDNGAANGDADAKVATTFDAYQTAAAAERERQTKALADLDAKIHYSTTPRLKSFLTLVGILDNDTLALGGPAAIFVAPQAGGPTRQAQAPAGDQGQAQAQDTAATQ